MVIGISRHPGAGCCPSGGVLGVYKWSGGTGLYSVGE